MPIPGNLLTTAMAVMPHKDINRAIEVAMSLDIPFWPQLPLLNYYEDMYVQASEHFPGMLLDMEKRTLKFSMKKFTEEFEETYAHMDDPEYFDISKTYSAVYHKFLDMDLSHFPAIRGQLEGPVSFGFNVIDQDTERPILFDDTIRPFMLEIMAKRINIQLKKLKAKNENAFMFLDEPGLQFIFSAMSGYNDITAKKDMDNFFEMIDKPRGIHLCGNPDWDFLLGLDMEILSLDAFTNNKIIESYAPSIKKFLTKGGIITWGIVPTGFEPFSEESMDTLIARLQGVWDTLKNGGVDMDMLLAQGQLSPATCCLVNRDGEKTVESAFLMIKELSLRLRERFGLV